jgi:hypothetical protein
MVALMKKKTLAAILLLGIGLAIGFNCKGNKMLEIKFSLGKNIVETAKASGIPQFGVDNVNGSIEYSARPLPLDVPVIYDRPGYEIKMAPAFSLALDADRRRTPDDIVAGASVQINSDPIKSHQAAQAFIEKLISQFNNGKWKRHIFPSCPSVTGRSSLLNVSGEIGSRSCAFDPHYRIDPSEWIRIFRTSQRYEWIGDGVFARLTVGYDDDIRGITYNISVDLNDYKTMLAVDAENEARENKEGDAKGWNTSVNAAKNLITVAERVRILEENAIKRGDTVIPR